MDGAFVGRHLIVDGYCHNIDLLNSEQGLATMLNELVDVVKMDLLLPAQMVKVELQPEKVSSNSDDGGVTGFAVLSTSHVSVHTWPLTKRFSLDLFSCHDYDPHLVIDFITDKLDIFSARVLNKQRILDTDMPEGIQWVEDEPTEESLPDLHMPRLFCANP
jgi:S-adenosylmethionine decarboxylase